MRVLFLIICIAVVLLSVAPGQSAAEETSYTIIVSNSTKSAVKNLQSSISNMMGENVSHRKIERHSPEAKEWIDLLEIKFVPYVIFSENIKKYEKFFSLLNNKAIISKNGQYVIPDKMLKPLGIMFLNRPIKSHQLDVFLMSKCPIGNSALQQLNNYLTANPNKFNINIHYIADFNEFGINSVRGAKEIKEDIRQLLVQKYYPDKFWQYHRLYLQKERYEAIFKKIAIDAAIIDSHKEDGLKLLKKDFNLYNELGIIYSINSSPTFLWENQVLLSSIRQVYEIIMPESNSYAEDIKKTAEGLPIIFFYGSKCPHCKRLLEKVFPELKTEFGEEISFLSYDIQIPQHAERKLEMEEKYGVKKIGRIPEVFVAEQALVGRREITKKLKQIIKNQISKKKRTYKEIKPAKLNGPKPYNKKINKRFQSFTPAAIIGAGLLDGINPCAFSTIIFFISFLIFAKFTFLRMLAAGSFFILAVFLTYLGLGLGAFVWLEKIRLFNIFSQYFDLTIGVLAILLGTASIYDYYIYKRTRSSKNILLKLPQGVKTTIHSLICTLRDKGAVSMPKLLLIAFGLGILISLLESICTGQIYVPILIFMIKMDTIQVKAFLYLLLYNIMFILPLAVVFLSTLFGVNSQWWAKFVQSNLSKVKLLTALFFFAMGILLILV